MANKNPPKHTQFKKGVSGNQSGRPKGLFTIDLLKKVIARHFDMTKEQVEKVLNDSRSKSIDLIICSAILKAIENGDINKAEYLFMRSLGRVTEKVEIQHPEPVVIQKANGEQLALDVRKDDDETN